MSMIQPAVGRDGAAGVGTVAEPRHAASRLKLLIVATTLGLIALIWAGLLFHLRERESTALAQVERDATNLVVAIEAQVERTLAGLDQVLLLTKAEYEDDPKQFDFQSWTKRLSSVRQVALQVSLVDASGTVIATSLGPVPNPAPNLSDREHFSVHRERADVGLFVSRALLGRISGRWSLQLTRRLDGPDGSFAGIVVISINPEYFAERFATFDVGVGGAITLFGKDGYVRARAPALPGLYDTPRATFQRSGTDCAELAKGQTVACRFRSPVDQTERVFAYRGLGNLPLYVSVGKSMAVIDAPLQAERSRAYLLGGVVTAALAAAVGLLLRELRARRLREADLRTSEARLRSALEAGHMYAWERDEASGQIARSDNAASVLGLWPGQPASGGFDAFVSGVHPQDRALVDAATEAALRQQRPYAVEFRYRRPNDGREVWLSDVGRCFDDLGSGRPRFVGLCTDITARKSAELALAESERRLRLLADHATDMVVQADLDTTRRYVSPAARELLGYEPEELIGTRPLDAVHPDDVPPYAAMLAALTQGRVDQAVHSQRYRRKDGSWLWVEANFRLIRDEATGAPTGYVAAVRDISARRAAEEAVAESERRYRLLADNASDLIVLGHADGRRSYISPAVTAMLGYSVEEAYAVPMRDWVHPDDLARVFAVTGGLTDAQPHGSVVYRLKRKDGAYLWAEAAFQRVVDRATGEVTIITAIRDVSERQRQAEALEQARDAAQAASEAKTQFLASMSHEIRTPLNGVLGYTELLLEDASLKESQRRHLERIHTAGCALLTIVNDVLDLSSIEAGRVELDRRPLSLAALIDNTVSIIRGAADRKSLTLHVEIAPGLPDAVVGDEDRLRQVLLNLLNNAVKFTLAGSVTLRVGLLAGTDEVRFAVSDTGIGIPADKADRLFERFSQVDGSIRREFGGTGLGLAISKRLAELMGGTIGVESVHLSGSTFWFTAALPAATREALGPGPAEAGPSGRPARLLLVEDLDINQDLAKAVLTAAGHEVDVVGDGADAVMAVQAKAYDLVLMDVQMPGMDGITATRHIRALAHPASRVPIVAMTANVLPAQIAEFRRAGMDAHVGKPFRRDDLLRVIQGQLAAEPEAIAEAPRAITVLDAETFADLRGMLGPARMAEMLQSLSERLRTFSAVAGEGERGRLAQEAHKLVSAAGMLGFLEVSGACAALESACADAGEELEAALARTLSARERALAEIDALKTAA
ncbi:MAG TPA: PAS domain S-box protein [Beijerinckiaceae bacterium]|jgi:PAS domain S-box-containing protein